MLASLQGLCFVWVWAVLQIFRKSRHRQRRSGGLLQNVGQHSPLSHDTLTPNQLAFQQGINLIKFINVKIIDKEVPKFTYKVIFQTAATKTICFSACSENRLTTVFIKRIFSLPWEISLILSSRICRCTDSIPLC
jgi:hypothetical protein